MIIVCSLEFSQNDCDLIPFRTMTGVDASRAVTSMIQNQDVFTWDATLDSLDIPDQFMTFAGIVCTAMTFVFEDAVVDNILNTLGPMFGLSDEIFAFLENDYLPAVRFPWNSYVP